jgi:hypothetical protein
MMNKSRIQVRRGMVAQDGFDKLAEVNLKAPIEISFIDQFGQEEYVGFVLFIFNYHTIPPGLESTVAAYSKNSLHRFVKKCSIQIEGYGWRTRKMSFILILMRMQPKVCFFLRLIHSLIAFLSDCSPQPQLVPLHWSNSWKGDGYAILFLLSDRANNH